MGTKKFFLAMMISVSAYASQGDIRMPDVLLDGIREQECYKSDKYCEPCVIRVNDEPDIKRVLKSGIKMDGFVIKCGTPEKCVGQTQSLLKMGIKSIDLGLYQINYKFHPKPKIAEYFDEVESREIANEILVDLVKTYGYSWETLGRYNYFNKEDNTRGIIYYKKLEKYVQVHSGVSEYKKEDSVDVKEVVGNLEEDEMKKEDTKDPKKKGSSYWFWN